MFGINVDLGIHARIMLLAVAVAHGYGADSFMAYDGDAGTPEAGLTMDGAGNLFGTTTYGGAISNGTIFELRRTGYNSTAHFCEIYNSTDTVLYSIPWSANNLETPYSGLFLDGVGNIFEATGTAGASNNGTIIELACTSDDSAAQSCQTYSSTGTVLYSLTGSGGDGAAPQASLTLDATGNLFGTTEEGGQGDEPRQAVLRLVQQAVASEHGIS